MTVASEKSVSDGDSGDFMPDESAQRATSILVVCGEASSDEHTSEVVRQIRDLSPHTEVFGMGGDQLRAAGMEIVVDAKESAGVMGFTEVFGSLFKILRAFRLLCREAARRKPQLAILVDFPDFNLRLAKRLHAQGIPILYFISPQIWAWRTGRVKLIKSYVSKVIPIFPFEESFFRRYGVDAEYLGHPFLDRSEITKSREQIIREIGLDPTRPLVALLPGSRKAEVERLLEPMLAAFRLVKQKRPELQAAIPVAATFELEWMKEQFSPDDQIAVVPGRSRELLCAADAAVVASGTATLEAALAAVPFLVVYRLSTLTYSIGKVLVRGVSYISIVNLIAGKKVVEELLQQDANAERIAQELESLLGDEERRELMNHEFRLVHDHLASGVDVESLVAGRVAKSALELINETRK